MKALVIEKPDVFEIQELSYPEPGPGEVTIQVKSCCVCGTDQHLIKGDVTNTVYPMIPGHEFSGRIDSIGPGVTDVNIGDVVSIEPFIACGHCRFCKAGDYNACLNGRVIGMSASTENVKLDGGFAEYVTVPQKNVYVFKNASYDEASFLPNLNTVTYGLRRADFKPGNSILIIGAGTMGLLYVQLAKANGSPMVAITDMAQKRLDLAKQLGADEVILADESQDENIKKIEPRGFDVVVECVGMAKLAEQAFHYVRNRGKIIFFGMAPKDQIAKVSPLEITTRNLEIIGSFSSTFCGQAATDLIDHGVIKIDPLITHTFPLSEFKQAVEQARRPEECIRVIVKP